MLDIIQRHLDAIEQLQADLEGRIKVALGDISPDEILARTNELPQEIADELESWIDEYLLQDMVDESVRFLEDMDKDEPVVVDEDRVRGAVVILLDHYKATIVTLATSIFSQIKAQADLQEHLGRSREAILVEMVSEKAGIGALVASLQNKLIVATDTFVSSAGGVVVLTAAKSDLTWITVQDKKVCDDCGPRHGSTHSATEWIEMGLPRTGWSVCGGRCRCVLVTVTAFQRSGGIEPVVRQRRR
jgi:hypothetical protein